MYGLTILSSIMGGGAKSGPVQLMLLKRVPYTSRTLFPLTFCQKCPKNLDEWFCSLHLQNQRLFGCLQSDR